MKDDYIFYHLSLLERFTYLYCIKHDTYDIPRLCISTIFRTYSLVIMSQLSIIESPSIFSVTECLNQLCKLAVMSSNQITYIFTVDVLPSHSNLE